jgi:hypothetical protein
MPWGTGKWGTSSWGSAATGISISNAFASSTHTVRVKLSSEPKHSDPLAAGDALNPQTWLVQRLDTGIFFTVLAAREFDPPFLYELLLLEAMADHLITHRVKSTTLVAANGIPIAAPSFFDFAGVLDEDLAEPVAATSARRFSSRDLANPPFPAGGTTVGGTLVIGAAGDYESEEGTVLLKKLVIRRLTTRPGEFFHLPGYGVGLTVKEPIPAHDLPGLKKQIERQIGQEPDVEAVQANLSLTANGVLTLQLRVRQKATGAEMEVGLSVPPGDGVAL